MSNVFGKIPISAGQTVIEDVGGSGLSGVLIANESGLTCTVELQGANVKRSLYAGTVDFFTISKGVNWTGNLIISPSADLNNISYWPSSFLQIDTFGLNERPTGTYPMNLNRTGNVGNQVTTTVGSATSVQNDNNAAGTSVVEATILGSPTSNVQIFNDGSGWIGRWVNPTFTKIFQWFSAGGTALQLGAVGSFLVEVLGNFKVDGNETVVGTGSFNAGGVTIDASSNINFNQANCNQVNTGIVAATTVNCTTTNATTLHSTGATNTDGNHVVGGTLNVTGLSTQSGGITTNGGDVSSNTFTITGGGQINLLTGTLARIHFFSVACINGKVSLNHGLGAIPSAIFFIPKLSGIPANVTYGYDPATLTASNVDVWANGAFNVQGIAIR